MQPTNSTPRIPLPFRVNGRLYLRRSQLDRYKAELQAHALGVRPIYSPPVEPDPFIPLKAVETELGIGRRTIGRRIAEAQAAAGQGE
jgi:hypothetical protein